MSAASACATLGAKAMLPTSRAAVNGAARFSIIVVSTCGINFGRFAEVEDLLTRCRSTLAAMANSIDRFPASFGSGGGRKPS